MGYRAEEAKGQKSKVPEEDLHCIFGEKSLTVGSRKFKKVKMQW
jgi:hypothetical protein